MNKYQTLLNILDQVRKQAPAEYKSYYPLPEEIDKLNHARSKAFIHLFLKVKFGLLEFLEREKFITDDSNDGGIDAYFIDEENRKIYFVQSKFRTNAKNFEEKSIDLDEILHMDIDRVTDGETTDELENRYNDKVQKLIRRLQGIADIGRYTYEVILLANVTKFKPSDIKKLIPGFPCVVFNFERCYSELVFPVVSGTYYISSDLYINISLTDKEYSSSRISYPVETELTGCEITVLFVPTIEIAKVLHKYKNSILKYNPRSYLDLSTNPVNKEIAYTITNKTTNEFSLFNNGVTMLSDETKLQEKVGKKNRGQLYIKNPQIINGRQTAYTLSSIYEDAIAQGHNAEAIFGDKEVLLKIITFTDISEGNRESVLALIEAISKATNQQTPVQEADRRSNDRIQIELQRKIFEEFGCFYERKRGEFYDGLKHKYVDESLIVERELFLRANYSMQGFPAQARRSGENRLFRKDNFDSILGGTTKDLATSFFAYLCIKRLEEMRKPFAQQPHNRFGVINYGSALRYGILAVSYVAYAKLETEITSSNLETLVRESLTTTLARWLDFEEYAKSRSHNRDYFRKFTDPVSAAETIETNFEGYYKGKTLNRDLAEFFGLSS